MHHFSFTVEFNLTQTCEMIPDGVHLPGHGGFCGTYAFEAYSKGGHWVNCQKEKRKEEETK